MSTPTDKSKIIDDMIDRVLAEYREKCMNRNRDIMENKCVGCDGNAVEFFDEQSRNEYSISGLCQRCQDDIFGA